MSAKKRPYLKSELLVLRAISVPQATGDKTNIGHDWSKHPVHFLTMFIDMFRKKHQKTMSGVLVEKNKRI